MSKEVVSFKCDVCGKLHSDYYGVCRCEYDHARGSLANAMLERGDELSLIDWACNFGWKLTDNQKKITKDSLFKISYLQCCERPVYKITNIGEQGQITVCGKGSDHYYYSEVKLHSLEDPQSPKEQL